MISIVSTSVIYSMQLFVCEYLCSGEAGDITESSLRTEGTAMLRAVCDDFVRIADCSVVTLWDESLGTCPIEQAEVIAVSEPEQAARLFRHYAATCDATFDIAPELDGILLQRRRIVEEVGGRYLGAAAGAIALCSDKLMLAQHLVTHGIPTIDTLPLEAEKNVRECGPLVVKRRDGAGSLGMRMFADVDEFRTIYQSAPRQADCEGMIVQPYIEGSHLSISAIIQRDPERVELFPVGEQRLTADGAFRYLGGRIPHAGRPFQAVGNNTFGTASPIVKNLVQQTIATIPGLAGYVGFDILLPAAHPAQPLLVEINPRLTTSYLGYRALAEENLAARLLGCKAFDVPIRWSEGAVEFSADGRFELIE